MTYYRATTHDLRSPIHVGLPIWDGSTPHTLPCVDLDTSKDECAPGWYACTRLEDAIQIAREWSDSYPSRLWQVAAVEGCPVITRGNKSRASSWTIFSDVSDAEAHAARLRLYVSMAGVGLSVDDIVVEVEAWRAALARPSWDVAAVEAGLRLALDTRGLHNWTMRRCWNARDVWDVWATKDARGAWAVWIDQDVCDARATRDVCDARAAKDAWAAWDPTPAWAAWPVHDAAPAWAARAALTVYVTARRGWTLHRADLLTAGIRDAYAAGLDVVYPGRPRELRWAMAQKHIGDMGRELT